MWCGTFPSRTGKKNVSPCCNLHSSVGWSQFFPFSADPHLATNFHGKRRCEEFWQLLLMFSQAKRLLLCCRGRAVEKMIFHLGVGNFPAKEPEVYKLIQFERDKGAPASRLKSSLEALAFCLHNFGMEELRDVVQSKRLHGATVSAAPHRLCKLRHSQ